MKPLVLIKTCQRFYERRVAIRETWLPALKWDRLFVQGLTVCPVTEENLIQFDAPDGWGNMAPKVRLALDWGLQHGYDWFFVCDDDTYVVPARLEAALDGMVTCYREFRQDYVGWLRENGGYCYPDPYIQGSGFWLSGYAADVVAHSDLMRPGVPDDVAVGQALHGLLALPSDEILGPSQTVFLRHDERYYPGPVAGNARPKPYNTVISTHKCLPETMRHIHRAWLDENAV